MSRRKLRISPLKNTIVWGDCKEWLPYVPSGCVDCIYIDPPFFTQKNYEIIWGNGYEKRSFTDRRKGGKETYIAWMRERLIKAKHVLKPTGSIFLHCDYRANYRLRMLLDEIFGEKNFINEIICLGDLAKRPPEKYLKNETQTIYWYSKNKNYKYISEGMFKETEIDIDSNHNYKQYSNGKYGYDLPKGDYCTDTLISKEKEGSAFKNSRGNWRVIKFLKRRGNKLLRTDKLSNLWNDLPRLSHLKNEKKGYPTQKTKALIKRVIECCTEKQDLVLDFFGGGGTTVEVAHELGRRFITGDVSPVACRVILESLKKAGCKNFEAKQIPKTKEEWHLTDGHKFAEVICEFMGWEVNKRKSGDGGIDGWANNKKVAVQIKHHKQPVGRQHIQSFIGSMTDFKEGIFVAWNFSPHAWEYVHIAEKKFGKKVTLKPAHEILGDLVLKKEEQKKYQSLYEKAVKKSQELSGLPQLQQQVGVKELEKHQKISQQKREKIIKKHPKLRKKTGIS